MKIIKPSVEFLGAVPTDYENALKFIELAGRTCYKSEDKITADSAKGFVRRLVKAEHPAMIEHSNFVVRLPLVSVEDWFATPSGKYLEHYVTDEYIFIGGNLTAWVNQAFLEGPDPIFEPFCSVYGTLFECGLTEVGTSLWEQCPHKEIPEELHRYSARFVCDRGVSHELVRHRPCSFAQESTRYVNYAGKEMEFIEPAGFEGWSEKAITRFKQMCGDAVYYYEELLREGLKPQQARAALPNALKTEVVVTADLQEWKHIFNLRCAATAHPDFRRLAILLRDRFAEEGLL